MKVLGKIILAILGIFAFVNLAFWYLTYHIGGLGYLYFTENVLNDLKRSVVISAISLIPLITVIILMFKGKRTIKITCTVLIAVFTALAIYFSLIVMAWLIAEGPNGCSHTEDITNYGKYDYEYNLSHFPDSITDDMTVVSYEYYYKYYDRDQVDIYLEIKFDNKATMDEYLTEAKTSFSEKGVVEYQNPFDKKYTDVIPWKSYYNDEWHISHNSFYFGGNDDYKYVEIDFSCISYSYADLTIIYNYTYIGSDIGVGNDLDNGYYYPHYLERFEIEWSENDHFSSKDLIEFPKE